MTRHEPIGDDEIFVGNTHKGQAQVDWLRARGVKSARLGNQALDIEGKRLPKDIYLPVIISRADRKIYNDVMNSQGFLDSCQRRINP
ncbi:hypothetical protein [Nitrosomonas communis]|uniref:hypothetical protein n=1 Tax=Nitrosomonas communis TaxID=44574 RepID=UPI0026EBCACD|nr:hypothetical protein [Nitrosomonas communis]MCO6427536.1 hypothetical protein [Nitrosomonas communis]